MKKRVLILLLILACINPTSARPVLNLTGNWAGMLIDDSLTTKIVDQSGTLTGTGTIFNLVDMASVTLSGERKDTSLALTFTFDSGRYDGFMFLADATPDSLIGVVWGSGYTGQNFTLYRKQ